MKKIAVDSLSKDDMDYIVGKSMESLSNIVPEFFGWRCSCGDLIVLDRNDDGAEGVREALRNWIANSVVKEME